MPLGNFFQRHNHHNHDGNLLWPGANVDNVDNYNFVAMALVVLWVWWKGWWSVCCGWWWWRITLPQSTPQNTTTINTTTIPTTIIFTDTKHSFTQYCSNLWILGRHRGRQGGSPPQVGDVGPDGEVLHQYNKHAIASYMSQAPVFSFSLLPTVCACTSNLCPAIVLKEADTKID